MNPGRPMVNPVNQAYVEVNSSEDEEEEPRVFIPAWEPAPRRREFNWHDDFDANGQPRGGLGHVMAADLQGAGAIGNPVANWDVVSEDGVSTTTDERYTPTLEQFVDFNAAVDYRCVICHRIPPIEPFVDTQPACKVIMCENCMVNYRRNSNVCPNRCQGPRANARYRPLEETGPRSRTSFNNLRVQCLFGSCEELPCHTDYVPHIIKCHHNPNLCPICKIEKGIHHNEDECDATLEALHGKILDLQVENDLLKEKLSTINEVRNPVSQLKEELELLKKKNIELESELETLRISSVPIQNQFDVSTISTNIRCLNSYRTSTNLFIHRGDNVINIQGLSLETTGSELIAEIEKRMRIPIQGSIIKMEHTVIQPSWKLRQHQIGHKPVHLTVLPDTQRLLDGDSLMVTIRDRGPVV